MRDFAWEFVIRHTTQDALGHVPPMAAADIAVAWNLAHAEPVPMHRAPRA